MNIGKGIKILRVEAGLQQKEMAKQLGISQNYLSLLENNKAKPSLDLLRKISIKFGVPTDFFLNESRSQVSHLFRDTANSPDNH